LPLTSGKSTAAERKALFTKPNAREQSIQRITGQTSAPPTNNGWSGVDEAMDNLGEMGLDEGSGAKKKGKGKQLLFTVSARPG